MTGLSVNIRGRQILSWGTVTITGFVNEGTTDDETSEDLEIDDENGDICTHISGFGEKADVNLEVIPESDADAPEKGQTFNYGSKSCVVLNISKKRAIKQVEKWTIKGKRHPNIPLS